jgi:AcrR family transcriptional regulator
MAGRVAAGLLAPKQQRSEKALDRLLAAAEALLEEKSLDAISVADVARRAGVAVGGFYQRFESKEALLRVLHDRYEAERTRALGETLAPGRWQGRPLAERVHGFARALVDLFRRRRGVLRSFVLRHWSQPGSTDPVVLRRLDSLYRDAAALFLERREEMHRPDPERAVRFALLSLVATCREAILFKGPSRPGGIALSDEELVEELTQSATRYLCCAVAPGRRKEKEWSSRRSWRSRSVSVKRAPRRKRSN